MDTTLPSNKPRNSVLYMFDPLKTPSTPRRDSPESPEAGSSDKENDAPGDLTAFFTRAAHYQKHVAPKTPKGRLIDFDTTVVLDASGSESDSDAESDSEEDNVQMFQLGDFPSDDAREPASLKRAPLVDIVLEENQKQPAGQSLDCISEAPSEGSSGPVQIVTAAPPGAPLAIVINSINRTHMSKSEPPLEDLVTDTYSDNEDKEEVMEDTIAIPLSFPQITVSSPTYSESDSLTEADLPPTSDSPTDRLFASSSTVVVPPLRRSPPKRTIAADDPRRRSVDLQTSFSMHMHSAEMSFDLLNDKISFFGGPHGTDASWPGGEGEDEEFDLDAEEENMEAAARAYELAEKEQWEMNARQTAKPEAHSEPIAKALEQRTLRPEPEAQVEEIVEESSTDLALRNARQLLSRMPVFSVPKDISDSVLEEESLCSRLSSMQFNELPLIAQQQSISERVQPSDLSPQAQLLSQSDFNPTTPVSPPVVEAPIPALRIVKKAWKIHGRGDSTTSTASSMSTSDSSSSIGGGKTGSINSRRISMSTSHPEVRSRRNTVTSLKPEPQSANESGSSIADTAAPPRAPRTIIRGVQRPPVGAEISNSGVILPSASGQAGAGVRVAVSGKARATSVNTGNARGRFAGVQRPNLQQGQRAPSGPAAASMVAQKTHKLTNASGTATATSGTSIGRMPSTTMLRAGVATRGVTSLKAPARLTSGAGSSSGSALPRPASRLPAPGTLTGGLRPKESKPSLTGVRAPSGGARRAF